MEAYRLRTDLERAVIDGFALPLGIKPGAISAPTPGYTVAYTTGRDEEPDTYSFYVAVSHERVAPILHRAFDLLPPHVYGIVEISSRDAYRSVDVFVGEELIGIHQFLRTWRSCERILLEDGSIAAGANSDDPYVEVFVDQWKGLSIIVPPAMRDDVELFLRELGLEEVPQTWPTDADGRGLADSEVRPVIAPVNGGAPDIDDLLQQLRDDWQLELNVDPETNVDEAGRELGLTLWHALVGVEDSSGDPEQGADVSVWATAGSLNDMEHLIDDALTRYQRWRLGEIWMIDRVAYDERPDELSDLPPRRDHAEVHLVQIEARSGGPEASRHG
ncbi:MAG: hypothetical protein ACYS0G_16010 [Planctomycetota bacterium]|jgi:hypothetical protein